VSSIYIIPRKRKSFLIIAGGSYFGIARSSKEVDEKMAAARRWFASRLDFSAADAYAESFRSAERKEAA
jgi:hypothetical protein